MVYRAYKQDDAGLLVYQGTQKRPVHAHLEVELRRVGHADRHSRRRRSLGSLLVDAQERLVVDSLKIDILAWYLRDAREVGARRIERRGHAERFQRIVHLRAETGRHSGY